MRWTCRHCVPVALPLEGPHGSAGEHERQDQGHDDGDRPADQEDEQLAAALGLLMRLDAAVAGVGDISALLLPVLRLTLLAISLLALLAVLLRRLLAVRLLLRVTGLLPVRRLLTRLAVLLRR